MADFGLLKNRVRDKVGSNNGNAENISPLLHIKGIDEARPSFIKAGGFKTL